ncbi:MAG: hypothetical protein PHV11_03515, partial [Candidatus Bipolaricaulis sp.]|nr:hypothetical protein [Candidatus Bipolaricaulis sp.]MDD5219616.1 hypothetical protein [Candidatus Bipolaricaulis sp.]
MSYAGKPAGRVLGGASQMSDLTWSGGRMRSFLAAGNFPAEEADACVPAPSAPRTRRGELPAGGASGSAERSGAAGPSSALLEIRDLEVQFAMEDGIVRAVDGVTYTIEAEKTLGVVGES